MRILVTGAGGFIGSNLCERLLNEGHELVGYDNFSTGKYSHIQHLLSNKSFILYHNDIRDVDKLNEAMQGCDFVFHLAANADVRHGLEHPTKDFEQNTLNTVAILELMRSNNIRNIIFASTGSVYGETDIVPTPENAPLSPQTSLYAASKLACESFIQAYSEGFDIHSIIFRFVSILGNHYTHGHVIDFYKKLRENPNEIQILGNGKQAKSYLDVQDCIDGLLLGMKIIPMYKTSTFNLGQNYCITVDESLDIICNKMKVNPMIIKQKNPRGWVGDISRIWLNCTKIKNFGWNPKFTIKQSIERTIDYLINYEVKMIWKS